MIRARARRCNAVATALAVGATTSGLGALAMILGMLLWNGIQGLSLRVFAESTPPPGASGGLLNAITGSLLISAVAVGIGAPVGILAGTWLAEYGRHTRLAMVARLANDILLSAPSIVIGLFVYETVVAPLGHFSGFAGAFALALIVLPVVVRTTEDSIALVPKELREAAASMGASRAAIVCRIIYRAAAPGLLTGMLFAVARIAGETAPLLFTALSNQFFSLDMTQPMASLPAAIFQFALSPYADWQQLAWVGALIVTVAVLCLNIAARFLTAARSSQ